MGERGIVVDMLVSDSSVKKEAIAAVLATASVQERRPLDISKFIWGVKGFQGMVAGR